MKVLVTGAGGQLGSDILKRLSELQIERTGVDVGDFDLTDQDAVTRYVCAYKPDVIIHCAAYTNVDKAETEPEFCMAVNATGTMNMVRAAVRVNAAMVYISTDYVFPGDGETPYNTDDVPGPKNVYGLSKLQGEEAVRSLMNRFYVVRTSWVFGLNGKNFVRTMLRLGSERKEINVVDDQVGSPTYTVTLARVICDLIRTEKYGVYHVTNRGFCSWADFAEEIMRRAERDCVVHHVSSAEYGNPTHRPKNSRMSMTSLENAGIPLPETWQEALDAYLREIRMTEGRL